MAKGMFGEILGLAVVGVAGYFGYEWLKGQGLFGAVAPAGSSGGSSGSSGSSSNTPPPPAAQQVLSAAAATNTIIQGQGGKADAYQWATLWNAAYPSAPLPDINATFYPNGLPTVNLPAAAGGGTQVQLPLMSLSDWLSKIKAAGVSVPGLNGFGAYYIPIPPPMHRGSW